MKKEITVSASISIGGAKPIPWDDISYEKKQELSKKMMANVSKGLERHFSVNPDRFIEFAKALS